MSGAAVPCRPPKLGGTNDPFMLSASSLSQCHGRIRTIKPVVELHYFGGKFILHTLVPCARWKCSTHCHSKPLPLPIGWGARMRVRNLPHGEHGRSGTMSRRVDGESRIQIRPTRHCLSRSFATPEGRVCIAVAPQVQCVINPRRNGGRPCQRLRPG
jgi:hypothetical protein